MADLVVIGRIIKAHGIRGEVVVQPLSDVPGRLDAGVEVLVGNTLRTITGSRPHQGRLLVSFEGVGDRTTAELLRGRELRAEAVDISDSDVYYAHELVGMAVRDANGQLIGTVVELIELPGAAGYDLLEVQRPDGPTFLLPAVDEYVEVGVDADGSEHLVVTDAPEGLL